MGYRFYKIWLHFSSMLDCELKCLNDNGKLKKLIFGKNPGVHFELKISINQNFET